MRFYKKALCVAVATVMLGCCGCQALMAVNESLPEDTIEEFENAYNDMDIDGMLACMDEKTVKSLTAGMDVAMNLIGAVSGVDLGISASDMIDLAPLMQGLLGEYAAEIGHEGVDFQVLETYIKGDKATVYFTEAVSGETMVINMVKDGGKWYMTLGTKLISAEEADRVIIAGQEETDEGKDQTDSSDQEMLSLVSKILPELPDIFDRDKLADFLKMLQRQKMGQPICEADENGVLHLSGFPGGKDVALSDYKVGGTYPNDYYANIDGQRVYLGAGQCYGFARYVQYKLYGVTDYNDKEGNFSTVPGSVGLTPSQVQDGSTFKELVKKAGPGAHIRTSNKNGNNPHSMIVTEVTDTGITIIDANSDGIGTVKIRTLTWEEYDEKYGERGLEFIKVYNVKE